MGDYIWTYLYNECVDFFFLFLYFINYKKIHVCFFFFRTAIREKDLINEEIWKTVTHHLWVASSWRHLWFISLYGMGVKDENRELDTQKFFLEYTEHLEFSGGRSRRTLKGSVLTFWTTLPPQHVSLQVIFEKTFSICTYGCIQIKLSTLQSRQLIIFSMFMMFLVIAVSLSACIISMSQRCHYI